MTVKNEDVKEDFRYCFYCWIQTWFVKYNKDWFCKDCGQKYGVVRTYTEPVEEQCV